MEKFEELKSLLITMEADALQFYNKGNKAAGTRVRGACQNLKAIASEIRAEITAKKNQAK